MVTAYNVPGSHISLEYVTGAFFQWVEGSILSNGVYIVLWFIQLHSSFSLWWACDVLFITYFRYQ